jgi:nicotinamidase-related amidase
MSDDARGWQEGWQGYRAKGLGDLVGFGERPAIAVVDFINAFTDPASPLGSTLDAEVAATRRVLDAARRRGVPVVFTTVAYDPALREAGVFVRKLPALKVLVRGSDAVRVDARLGMQPDEFLIVKHYASAFFGTSLASFLTAQGVDTLIVTGCTTSGCVRATVVDALQHGFRAIVPRQCVGDRLALAHEANLFDMHAKYGDVVDVQEVLDYLGARRAS